MCEPRFSSALKSLIEFSKPNTIVEFGSWKGQSAVAFLQFAKDIGLYPQILCVDTWLGSIEHWENRYPDGEFSFESLGVIDGQPSILQDFRCLIDSWGFSSQVKILRCPSAYSGHFLSENWFMTDLVYIDASHRFLDVLRDLRIVERTLPKAIKSGDDFSWKAIRLALVFFLLTKKSYRKCVYVAPNKNSWVLLSRNLSRESISLSILERDGWKKYGLLMLSLRTLVNWLWLKFREVTQSSAA